MIHVIRTRATPQRVGGMQEALETCAKLAVHIWRGLLAGGGIMHADCEAMVYEDGSWQDDAPGAEWDPGSQQVTFEAPINIRPRQKNPSLEILAADTREGRIQSRQELAR